VGCAVGSGFGVAAATGAFRVVEPRRRVWAIDVAESVRKRINERAPKAVFIRKLEAF
jgi:hypothetical protein